MTIREIKPILLSDMGPAFSDEQLIEQAQGGDREAFATLVQRYAPAIFRFTARIVGNSRDAEDASQEAFLKAWQKRKSFDAQRKWKAWLFQIAYHAAIDVIRTRQPETFFSALDAPDGDLSWDLPDQQRTPIALQLERTEEAMALEQAVRTLQPLDRAIFELYYHQELNFREIGETLNMPINTVKSRHRRALIQLRSLYAPKTTQ